MSPRFLKPLGALLVCALLLSTVAGANAPPPEPQTTMAGPDLDTPLTLARFLEQVRIHHPKLFSADLERRIAGAKLLEKQGAFDPSISLETEYLRYNDFSKRGKVSKTFDNDLTFSLPTRSGLRLFSGARYNTGDVKPPLYPTGDSGEYFMGLKMPLLRGFRINDKVAAEMQAQLGIPLADATYQQTRLSLLQQAAVAYWNWVIAQRKVDLAQNLLLLAQQRCQAVEARFDQGDVPQIDVTEARQEVLRREGLVAKANREYEKHVFKLSQYLWEPGGKPSGLPEKVQIPTHWDKPTAFSDDDWMTGRQMALEKRPELKALSLQKEVTEVDLRFAQNQRLPILDLFATPGYDTGGRSISPTLKAGVNFVVPLRQRTAKGLILAVQYKTQKLDMDQRLLLQQVLLEVDDAVSAIRAATLQYEAAQKEYEMAQALEQGERDRFEFGDSTLFLVNQRERGAAEAALKRLDLEAEYQQALANYQVVTGQW